VNRFRWMSHFRVPNDLSHASSLVKQSVIVGREGSSMHRNVGEYIIIGHGVKTQTIRTSAQPLSGPEISHFASALPHRSNWTWPVVLQLAPSLGLIPQWYRNCIKPFTLKGEENLKRIGYFFPPQQDTFLNIP
jgi:hypothetical protein